MVLRTPIAILVFFTLAPIVAAAPSEQLPAGMKITAIEASPTSIDLKHRFDYRQILLTGRTAANERIDVTRMAVIEQVDGDRVSISPQGLVRAVADGTSKLRCTVDGQTIEIPVKVSGVQEPFDVSYIRDVTPVMSKLGCNAGTCHGGAKGKNGFKLSLRGYDPQFDYTALTDDIAGRRFNRAAPDESLMLLKPAGLISHVGGMLMKPGEPNYELLRAWIAAGVKLDMKAPRVAKIEVFPKNPIVPLPKMTQQIVVHATYADGSVRDVTAEAFVESGNIEVIEASKDLSKSGLVTMLRRGESPVLVRYQGAYAATTLTVMGDRSGFVWEQPPTNNYVDELVYKKLQVVRTAPGQLCDDAEFIRRVSLDLTGLPPSMDAVQAFLDDPRESRVKRDDLVDRLVGNPDFVEHWTNKWADLLQVNRKFLGEEGSIAFRNWIRGAVATNMRYDEFVRTILTASGSNQSNPAASYFKTLRTPQDTMENTTQLFLAVRFNCNKCHDHPFERWTQGQYYHLSAYFAQVARKKDPAGGDRKIGGSAVEGATDLFEIIYDAAGGEVKHEGTGQVAAPQFPYEHADKPADSATRRQQLAHWVTSKDNQYFAKSYANRLWGYLLGVGLIEPIDDIRAGNPPTNPELLDALTKDFLEHNFDAQHMIRTICKSRTYQHSIVTNRWNEDDTINYSHALARRLPAEVLFDAIHRACGSQPRIPGVPVGFRAAQLPDAGISLPFLDDFGRPPRESACECERSSGVLLAPVLKLVNGPTVSDAINDPANALADLVKREADDAKLVEALYLRFLARRPNAREIDIGTKALQASSDDFSKSREALAAYEAGMAEKQVAWEKAASGTAWTALVPVEAKSAVGANITIAPDGVLRVFDKLEKDTYTIVTDTALTGITGVRLEALASQRLPALGPGRAENGNFVVSELRLSAAPQANPDKAENVPLKAGIQSYAQDGFSAAATVDGNLDTGWAIHPQAGKNHTMAVETSRDVGHTGGTRLVIQIVHNFADGKHNLGKFRLSVSTSPRPLALEGVAEPLATLLTVAADKRTAEQKAALAAYFRGQDAEWKRLTQAVAEAEQQEKNKRLTGAQDLAWALINSPAFLFNR